MDLWKRFLANFRRRFLLHGETSAPILSDTGIPEGDGLSVFAMAPIDLSWACYQQAFAPQTIPLSYADNFGIIATSHATLLVGVGVLGAFMTMWHLELDDKKTFFLEHGIF